MIKLLFSGMNQCQPSPLGTLCLAILYIFFHSKSSCDSSQPPPAAFFFFFFAGVAESTYAVTSVRAVQVCERAGTVCGRSQDLIYNAEGWMEFCSCHRDLCGWMRLQLFSFFVCVSYSFLRGSWWNTRTTAHAQHSGILHLVHCILIETHRRSTKSASRNSQLISFRICWTVVHARIKVKYTTAQPPNYLQFAYNWWKQLRVL